MTIHPEIIKTNKVITHLLEVPACLAEALHPTDWCRRRQIVCPWEDSRSPTEELEAEAADLQERPERCPSLPPGRSWLVGLPSLIHCSLLLLLLLLRPTGWSLRSIPLVPLWVWELLKDEYTTGQSAEL